MEGTNTKWLGDSEILRIMLHPLKRQMDKLYDMDTLPPDRCKAAPATIVL